jgi:4-hydroxythreonine-4-phosphate dehydrogenase
MKPILGVMLGEATGIGPELVAKLVAQDRLKKYCRPVLIGDARVLTMGQKIAGVQFPFAIVQRVSEVDWQGPIAILDQKNHDPHDLALGKIDAASGRITGDNLLTCLKLLQNKAIDGLVFAPLNKEALQRSGYEFEDEHRLFAHYLNWDKPFGELNVLSKLWTSRVTSHIPLRNVAERLTVDNVLRAIRLIDQSLKRAGYEKPAIGVAALNPHAGEGGLCGREELDVIGPAIAAACREGIEAKGPYPSDTIFINAFKGGYDAVVTMFHDQGQIAMKLMGFQFGVTVAGGLPYAITTPAHGTAFDIAGQGVANPDASEQAVLLAARLAGWRG